MAFLIRWFTTMAITLYLMAIAYLFVIIHLALMLGVHL